MQPPNNRVNPRLVSLLADMVEAALKRDSGGCPDGGKRECFGKLPPKQRHKPLIDGNGLRYAGGDET